LPKPPPIIQPSCENHNKVSSIISPIRGPCFQDAYNLTALYNEGITGQGQTIVIIDSYGSPTALADLQQFSSD
jgi:subtilase family serine protease